MKKYFYDVVFFVGFVIWIGGSWFFGWNETAVRVGEKFTDSVGVLFMLYGAANSFVRGIKTEVTINNNQN